MIDRWLVVEFEFEKKSLLIKKEDDPLRHPTSEISKGFLVASDAITTNIIFLSSKKKCHLLRFLY